MNNSSLKKRLLSVAMAAVMVFSLLPATAWAAMAENLPAASGQTRTEQKRGGSDTYTVTRDVKSVAAAQTGAVKKVVCLDLTTGKDQVSLDADGGYRWVAGANYLYLYKVQIEAEGSNALILPAGATVEVVGKCSITGGGANECAVWSKGDVTVGLGQDATLTVNGLGWRAEGNLTVAHAYDAYTGGELTVNYNGTSSDNGTSGAAIYMGGNTLRVEQGARVTANGSGIGNVKAKDSCGVKGAVYVDGGAELVADGGSAGSAGISYGIFGDVTVKNGTVTATGGSGLQSYGVSGNSVSVSDGGVLNANGGTAVQDLNSGIKPISGGIYLGNNAVIENAAVNASGGVAPCGDSFASVGLQMTSRSEVTVNSGGVLNANGGQLTNGSSANETNGFSAGINMMDASEANLFVNGTGRVTAIGNPERLDGGTVISYGVNHTDMGELTIELSGVASFKAAGGTAASRAAFTPDTVSIKGSEAYRDFDNVTDGYKFLNSTYVRNDVPAQSLVVTVCDHRAGVTNGKCNNCGAEVAAAAVTDAAGVTTGYGSFEEAVNAAARLDGSTVRLLADAAVEANYTIAAGTFTIDFNGRKLTVAENNFFAAQTAEVTLTDSASIKVGQPCVPNAAEGGRIIVESGKFGGGIVQHDDGTLLLNGGYFGMITLMDPNENVMDLLGAGKAYRSVLGADAWQDDSNADTTSVAGQKRLHEVEVVDAPLRIIQQTPASGTLTVYETSPTIPSLKVTAAYDSAMSWVFDAKLYYRASAIDEWSTADAPKVSSDGNGTVTVSSNTTLKTGQYQLQLTFHGYRAESRVFNVTLEPCGHPDIDANGKCGTCQYQFVATLTDAAGEVTGYDTLNGALAEVKALSADAQNASRYTVRLHRDVTEDVRVTGGKFTLDLNGKTATVPSGLAISGTTDIGIQNGKLVSDVTVSSASLTVSAAEGLGRITLQGSANVQFYPDASASAFKVESANALLIMNGGTVGTIDMTGGEVRVHFNAKVTGQVNADGGELSVREAPVFDGDVRIGGGARMTVVPNSTAKFNGVLEFAEEAVGELAGGTYKKLGIAAGRTLSELLKSGYVYYRVDISEFIQGKTDNLTNVKVISHVHSIRGDGTCACGESFTASVSSGASVDWYKTLSEALAAVKTLSAGVQDAALYTVRLYQDAAEDVSINGGKFTLDLNGHKAGNTAFTAGGSAAVILSGGEVSCNMQVRDTADLTVNGTVLRDVELYGSAKLTASGAAMGHLQTRDGTPAAVVTGGTISRITMQAGMVGLTGSVTVENQTEVLSGGVLTVTAQSGEPEFRNAVTIGDGGKLVASAGKFRSNVEFGIGAKGELSGGEYGGLECGGDQLLKDMLKTGYAYFGIEHLENGYVNSLMSQSYTVRPHSNHSYEWDATTHEKKCGCGDVSETDTAAPVIGFLNGAALKTENGRQVMDVTDNVIYTVTDANEVRVTVSYGSGTAAEVRPDAGGRYELPLSEGDGKPVTITAADEAGNVTTVTFTLYRLVDMRISSHVGVAVEETDLTRTVRSGQTYTLRVTMLPGYTGEDGLELEQGALTTKQRFTGSDAAGYTVQVTADFNNSLLRIVGAYDNTPPTAEITIRNSSFRNFLNRISFGLFFKETQTVSVTAADVGAGLDKVEYLLSGTAIVCMYYYPERAMEGKISGDDLSVVMGQANADSPDVGRRTVTFTGFALAGSDAANYTLAAQPISGSAAITARPLSIGSLTVRDKLYDGLNTAAIEGTPTLVNLADGETLMLRCGTPTFDTVAAGDNIPVSFTEFTIADSANGKAGNYSLTQPAGITASIRAYTATGAEYTASTGQWTNQNFMVTAADGWQVSGTNTANGDWRGSLTRSDETGTGSLTFYVKNTADGYISESVTLTYKIDKTDPTGEIRIDQRNAWQSFWNTISFDLFYKSRQTVTMTAADEASGVTAIEYLLTEEDYTTAQLDGMTLQPYTAPVAITPDDRLIAYARITDAAGNITYLRSDGVVLDAAAPVIAGVDDGAVYCGSVTFTVTDAYLDTVTVDGTAAVSVPSRAAGSTYIIEADSQLHTIVATDRAGNSTRVQITVNNGHTVGTPASCKAPAVCRYCGESFGDPAPGNHGGLLRRVEKVNATSTADGNIEYWYCSGCGKYYLDAAAGREITRGDTILPAIGLRIVDDVRVWRPGDKPLGVTFRQEYDDFTAQIDGVTVDPANYEVTADPDGGRLIVTFRAQFLRTLVFGERTITIASDDGSASVSFRRDSARAATSGGKDGGKAGVTSAATGDGFPMGGMAAALLVSGSALVMLTTRARRKEEE